MGRVYRQVEVGTDDGTETAIFYSGNWLRNKSIKI